MTSLLREQSLIQQRSSHILILGLGQMSPITPTIPGTPSTSSHPSLFSTGGKRCGSRHGGTTISRRTGPLSTGQRDTTRAAEILGGPMSPSITSSPMRGCTKKPVTLTKVLSGHSVIQSGPRRAIRSSLRTMISSS